VLRRGQPNGAADAKMRLFQLCAAVGIWSCASAADAESIFRVLWSFLYLRDCKSESAWRVRYNRRTLCGHEFVAVFRWRADLESLIKTAVSLVRYSCSTSTESSRLLLILLKMWQK